MSRKGKKKKILKILVVIILCLVLAALFLFKTQTGRRILYRLAAHVIHTQVQKTKDMDQNKDTKAVNTKPQPKDAKLADIGSGQYPVRKDKHVLNFLLIGIEEIGGARNTDSMMIASLNTEKKTIKLTSLMRDSYVDIPGYRRNKLNSSYGRGGIKLLVDTIEKNYKISLNGYASVNFDDFDKMIDLLGGVKIKLTRVEANYLNTTNYISNPRYRHVVEGVNLLNGNQALGYCRVRHVPTLGNVPDDYGRTLRQRRVLNKIFEKFKSYNALKQIKIADQGLNYITTDLSEDTIALLIEEVMENKISKIHQYRLPVEGAFTSPKIYEGITYPLVYDWNKNIEKLFMFLYGDTQAEAQQHLVELQQ
ncbi:LCP family protein [Clostridium oryzae]|uniref:Regulatory protein MsrR n=1 Tax=Clostridium oryzae TaxID=1450648 RepID=A0A1V4IXW9_9CLOT|nr:LCP family protein [Clostridium oryzae]OPJ64881.1 regulatory protein MsrR [Clostridium oryzae]